MVRGGAWGAGWRREYRSGSQYPLPHCHGVNFGCIGEIGNVQGNNKQITVTALQDGVYTDCYIR